MVIVDHIRLKDSQMREAFLHWVQQRDYLACQQLDSVQQFMVYQQPGSELDFFELVYVSSFEAFQHDMATPLFQSLVAEFSEMAEVTAQWIGTEVGSGYAKP